MFHYFSLVEFIFLSLFFFELFEKLGREKNVLWILIPGIILINCNAIYFQDLNTFNSNAATFVSIVVILYCLYYFYITIDPIIKSVPFNVIKWIVIALFIYHSISIIVLLFSNALLNIDVEKQYLVWAIRALVILGTKILVLSQFVRLFFYKERRQIISTND